MNPSPLRNALADLTGGSIAVYYILLASSVCTGLAFLWNGCNEMDCLGWAAGLAILGFVYACTFFLGLLLLLVSAFVGPPRPVFAAVVLLSAIGMVALVLMEIESMLQFG